MSQRNWAKAGRHKNRADAAKIRKEALSDMCQAPPHCRCAGGGFFSQSGLDSTTLTALGRKIQNQLHAVTLGFDEYRGQSADELPLAKQAAARYGCIHHVSSISNAIFDVELPAILHAMDQPSIDGVNTYFVARAARHAGLKVRALGSGRR